MPPLPRSKSNRYVSYRLHEARQQVCAERMDSFLQKSVVTHRKNHERDDPARHVDSSVLHLSNIINEKSEISKQSSPAELCFGVPPSWESVIGKIHELEEKIAAVVRPCDTDGSLLHLMETLNDKICMCEAVFSSVGEHGDQIAVLGKKVEEIEKRVSIGLRDAASSPLQQSFMFPSTDATVDEEFGGHEDLRKDIEYLLSRFRDKSFIIGEHRNIPLTLCDLAEVMRANELHQSSSPETPEHMGTRYCEENSPTKPMAIIQEELQDLKNRADILERFLHDGKIKSDSASKKCKQYHEESSSAISNLSDAFSSNLRALENRIVEMKKGASVLEDCMCELRVSLATFGTQFGSRIETLERFSEQTLEMLIEMREDQRTWKDQCNQKQHVTRILNGYSAKITQLSTKLSNLMSNDTKTTDVIHRLESSIEGIRENYVCQKSLKECINGIGNAIKGSLRAETQERYVEFQMIQQQLFSKFDKYQSLLDDLSNSCEKHEKMIIDTRAKLPAFGSGDIEIRIGKVQQTEIPSERVTRGDLSEHGGPQIQGQSWDSLVGDSRGDMSELPNQLTSEIDENGSEKTIQTGRECGTREGDASLSSCEKLDHASCFGGERGIPESDASFSSPEKTVHVERECGAPEVDDSLFSPEKTVHIGGKIGTPEGEDEDDSDLFSESSNDLPL